MTASPSVPEKYSVGKGKACKWGVKNKGRCNVKCLLFWYWALESRINIPSYDADCGWQILTAICRLFAHSWDSTRQFSFFILFSRKCDKYASLYFQKFLPDFYLYLSNFIVNLSSVGRPHGTPISYDYERINLSTSCGQCKNMSTVRGCVSCNSRSEVNTKRIEKNADCVTEYSGFDLASKWTFWKLTTSNIKM